MTTSALAPRFTRRAAFALTGAAAIASLVPARAFAQAGGMWQRIDEALDIVGDADPIAQGIVLNLPAVSENGATVPLTVGVDRPMDEGEHVTAIHIFAPANPYPHIATFRLGELSGHPEIETRVRINESQTLVAIAELSSGAMLVGEREVRVTVSGCLTMADTYDSDNLFQTRVRAPDTLAAGESGEVLTMINHPQETGLREGTDGETVPKRLIEYFEASLDGETVFSADLHRSVAANPYVKFYLTPQTGGTLNFMWREDTGETTEASADIQVS